jgi:hypothetical protein
MVLPDECSLGTTSAVGLVFVHVLDGFSGACKCLYALIGNIDAAHGYIRSAANRLLAKVHSAASGT